MQGGLLQSAGAEPYFKLDPRTKLLLMVLINATIFRGSTVCVMAAMGAIPIFLLLAGRKPKAAVISAVIYTASALANEYLVPATHGILNIFVVMMAATTAYCPA